MLNENIKIIRKSKGLSQEELAIKLNVVRQTISKWEKGLSVPDSEMLISISEIFEVPVGTLLGENITTKREDDLKVICEKLEVINLQLSKKSIRRKKVVQWLLISLCILIVIIFGVFVLLNSSYLGWDYSSMENAVLGVTIHSIEWLFIRVAPIVLVGAIITVVFIRKKT